LGLDPSVVSRARFSRQIVPAESQRFKSHYGSLKSPASWYVSITLPASRDRLRSWKGCRNSIRPSFKG
jgi:hypothetical protein